MYRTTCIATIDVKRAHRARESGGGRAAGRRRIPLSPGHFLSGNFTRSRALSAPTHSHSLRAVGWYAPDYPAAWEAQSSEAVALSSSNLLYYLMKSILSISERSKC